MRGALSATIFNSSFFSCRWPTSKVINRYSSTPNTGTRAITMHHVSFTVGSWGVLSRYARNTPVRTVTVPDR